MPVEFHGLRVININRETGDTVSVSFDVPAELKETFSYLPGQYLTLKLKEDAPANRRAYSISSSPYTGELLTVTIKKAATGHVSKILHDETKVGDMLELLPPLGRFTIGLDPANSRTFVMIGAGSGITPIISIIKSILKVEPQSSVLLIYQNRNENTVIFKDLIGSLEREYPNFRVFSILSNPSNAWTGMKGQINGQLAMQIISANSQAAINTIEYFICGPAAMMLEMQSSLFAAGVNSVRIHKEMFTAPPDDFDEEKPVPELPRQFIASREITVKLYGDTNSLQVEPDETITQAAMRAGLEPPFSCQIGACSTCRAKIISGKVLMDEKEALTEDEINDGYVLTCQSHPLTDDVFIDFDF